jgi:protein-disulfide isomerase
VSSTPSFRIGDRISAGALTFDQMKEAVQQETARLAGDSATR